MFCNFYVDFVIGNRETHEKGRVFNSNHVIRVKKKYVILYLYIRILCDDKPHKELPNYIE